VRPAEYREVARRGERSVMDGFVVLVGRAGGVRAGGGARLGITVSRRVGSAVVRNRVKRRVREWFRAARGQLDPAVDLVVIGRRSAGRLGFREIVRQLDAATGSAQGGSS